MTPADKLVRYDDLSADWGPAYQKELAELAAMFDDLTRRSKDGGSSSAGRRSHKSS